MHSLHERNYARALRRRAETLGKGICSPVDYRLAVVLFAYSLVGMLEQPARSNRGPVVGAVRSFAGRPLPENESKSGAWCAFFVSGVFSAVAEALGGETTIRGSGSVSRIWSKNEGRDGVFAWAYDDWLKVAPQVDCGGLIFCRSGDVSNHTGIVVGRYGDRLLTVEGNTSPDLSDSHEDGGRGGGVFAKFLAVDDERLRKFGIIRPGFKVA